MNTAPGTSVRPAGGLTAVRRQVGRILGRVRRPGRRHPAEGLPPGLDGELLRRVCRDATGSEVAAVRHLHHSPFKAVGGAYRVLVDTTAGSSWSVYFKDCRYDAAAFPGAVALPLTLGPPEHAVYGAGAPLVRYLPRVHHRAAVVPGLHYRYLLEDLRPRFGKCVTGVDILRAVDALPTIATAASQALRGGDVGGLVRYDAAFVTALAAFAHENLARYADAVAHPVVGELLHRWPAVRDALLDGALRDGPVGVVHGDLNRASALVAADGSAEVRVIDWESAGVGPLHIDLALLLEDADQATADEALRRFARAYPDWSPAAHRRHLGWASLMTSVKNGTYLAVQTMDARHRPRADQHRYLGELLARALRTHAALAVR